MTEAEATERAVRACWFGDVRGHTFAKCDNCKQIAAEIQRAVAEERERAAQIVEAPMAACGCVTHCDAYGCRTLQRLAAAIRSRSVQDTPASTACGQASNPDVMRCGCVAKCEGHPA